MRRIQTLLLALLVLLALGACGQEAENSPEASQLYAASDNYFNLEQTLEWDEMGLLLRGLEDLEEDQPYELGRLMGVAESMSIRLPPSEALALNVPDEVVSQILPEDVAEAYDAYSEARGVFLDALRRDPSALAAPDTPFREAVPGLIEGLEAVDVSLRLLRGDDQEALLAQHSEALTAFAAQLKDAVALLG